MPLKKRAAAAVGSCPTGRAARKSTASGAATSRKPSGGSSENKPEDASGARTQPPAARRTRSSAAAEADPTVAAEGLMDLTRALGSQRGSAATPPRSEGAALLGPHGSAGKRASSGRLQQAGSYSRMALAGGGRHGVAGPSLPGFSLTEGNSSSGAAGEGGGLEPGHARRRTTTRTAADKTAPDAPPAGSDPPTASASQSPASEAASSSLTGKRQRGRQQQQQSAPAQAKKKNGGGRGGAASPAKRTEGVPRAARGKSKSASKEKPQTPVRKVSDEEFKAWGLKDINYSDDEKTALFIAALRHGSSFHSTQWTYNNSLGKYSWLEHLAKPAAELLGRSDSYKSGLVKTNRDPEKWLKDFFLSAEGLVKIKNWFKSQKNQATTYHKNHGQTGASGGKIEVQHVKLRQQLYSTNPAVVKADMRQSKLPPLPPVGGSAEEQLGGSDEEQPEVGGELSWEQYGVNTVVDTGDGGANMGSILDVEDEQDHVPGEDGQDEEFDIAFGDGGFSPGGNDDQDDEEENEEITGGGGSSRAGVPSTSRGSTSGNSSGPSSGGGGGGGGGSSSGAAPPALPARLQGNAKGKGKATSGARHQKKGTHGDIDDELMQNQTSSRAVPPKRNGHWQPPGKGGLLGALEDESKDRKEKNAILASLAKAQTAKSSGPTPEELTLRRDELTVSKRKTDIAALAAFGGHEGVFNTDQLKKMAPLLFSEEVRAALGQH